MKTAKKLLWKTTLLAAILAVALFAGCKNDSGDDEEYYNYYDPITNPEDNDNDDNVYIPTENQGPYTVEHWFSEWDSELYEYITTLVETEYDVTEPKAKNYTGYTYSYHSIEGSLVKLFYHLNYVTVTFLFPKDYPDPPYSCDESGYFGEPINFEKLDDYECDMEWYARNYMDDYYHFVRWEPDLKGVFPAEDTVFTPVFSKSNVKNITLDKTEIIIVGGNSAQLSATVEYFDESKPASLDWDLYENYGTIDNLYGTIDNLGNINTFEVDSTIYCTISVGVASEKSDLYAECTLFILPKKLTQKDFREIIGLNGYAYIKEFTIPDGVTEIDDGVFYNCPNLTSIIIPNSVTSIGDSAFKGCSSLTNISIPNSVTSIGKNAFNGCSKLTSISIPSSVTSISDYTFENCSSLTSISIPNSVTSISDCAFQGCSSLETITIPNSVTSISRATFLDCSSLTSISIPNGVTSIEPAAFEGCSSLTSISIPNSVTSISIYAFRGCSSLKIITIPKSVTSIGTYAFENCKFKEVHYTGNIADWCGISFHDELSNPMQVCFGKFYINNNTELSTSIEIPNSVTSIGNNAFRRCSSLENVTIPNSVTSIGNNAFDGCSSLKTITIPDSVTYIGQRAFASCALTSITIPSQVTYIGAEAFVCKSLMNVYFQDKRNWMRVWYNSVTDQGTNISSTDLENILKAAEYLRDTYKSYNWCKKK